MLKKHGLPIDGNTNRNIGTNGYANADTNIDTNNDTNIDKSHMLEQFLSNKNKELAPHFKPGFLQRELTTFQFLFDAGEPFYLTVRNESFEFKSGHKADPTITLYVIDHGTCWGLLEGTQDGMRAFMEGSYRADGNIVLSQLILYLFKSNDPTLIYEVQD